MYDINVLSAFIDEIWKEADYSTFSEIDENESKDDLLNILIDRIEVALVDALPEEKAQELGDRLEQGEMSDAEIAEILKAGGVNINEITENTKRQFKKFFLTDYLMDNSKEKGEGE